MRAPLRLSLAALALALLPMDAQAADAWPPPGGSVVDRLVAIVNTEPITLFELRRAAAPHIPRVVTESSDADALPGRLVQLQAEVLDNLINDILIFAQAKTLGLTVPAEKVETYLTGIREANGWTEDDLAEQLRRLGFASLADFRRHTEREMLKSDAIRIRIGARVKVDEKEVEALVQRRLGEENTVEERRAAHILLKVDSLATRDAEEAVRLRLEQERERILAGEESFEEVARRISEDAGTQPAGGDLSWFTRGDFDPEFESAAFGLEEGVVSEPVRTQFGWHLIVITGLRDRRVQGEQDLEKMRREIRFTLRQQELERLYLQWVRGLRAQAFVEIKDDRYVR